MSVKLPQIRNSKSAIVTGEHQRLRDSSSNGSSKNLLLKSEPTKKVEFNQYAIVKEIARPNSSSMSDVIEKCEPIQSNLGATLPEKTHDEPKVDVSEEKLVTLTQNLKIDNNKFDSHWIVYKQEETPEYIIEAKKRLGQIKQPNLVVKTEEKKEVAPKPVVMQPVQQPVEQEKTKDGKIKIKHWLQWDNPSTPDKIREIRHRLGDDRYRKMFELERMVRSKTIDSFDNNRIKIDRENLEANLVVNNNGKSNEAEESNTDKLNISYIPTNETEQKVNYLENDLALSTNQLLLPSEQLRQDLENIASKKTDTTYVYDQLLSKNNFDYSRNAEPVVPLESWLQTASEKEKDTVLRVLKSLEESRPSQMIRMQAEPRIDNNQYVRVKAKDSNIQNKFITLRKRPQTTNHIRKLGTIRNNFKPKDNQDLDNYLFNSIWPDQDVVKANGPATVYYGYNV